ncbi:hypothetical protein VCR12J2_1390021 [Vibrio coralliirubri]|uniref:Uncharacterized protein n=1 Tax=Vibrio crassostreae TaxID=246167 RepID=A0A822N3G3_9VIBR|nr:hypothetical protein VCR5J5_270011 [Vibrio crassostreae]CDT56054.1 hypothetical protein VCR20J5_670021 [Vibrio crassostreae]CDT90692.1 hypothetical protein VCR12J2_1390021 [Vibrio coralliirubri]
MIRQQHSIEIDKGRGNQCEGEKNQSNGVVTETKVASNHCAKYCGKQFDQRVASTDWIRTAVALPL